MIKNISKKAFILLAVLALITTLTSLVQWVMIEHRPPDEFTRVGYGWPIVFVLQDWTTVYTPSSSAIPDGYTASEKTEVRYLFMKFFLNFGIHLVVLLALFTLFKRYNPLRR